MTDTIVVTAAVIERDGTFLVTRRQAGVHLEGFWEFPGGKCEANETHAECLRREIREELDADVLPKRCMLSTSHNYPERRVELHFYECTLIGDPRPLLGQDMRWIPRTELASLSFPPADAELLQLLARSSL